MFTLTKTLHLLRCVYITANTDPVLFQCWVSVLDLDRPTSRIPVSMGHWDTRSSRRWTNIEPTLGQCYHVC